MAALCFFGVRVRVSLDRFLFFLGPNCVFCAFFGYLGVNFRYLSLVFLLPAIHGFRYMQ